MPDRFTQYQGKTTLVTGASGFIGAQLCQRLLEAGATVHAVSRSAQPAGSLHWHQCELADEQAVDALLATTQPQVIFHLASYVSGSRDISAVVPAMEANLASTVHLLTAAQRTGIERFVNIGSLEEPVVEDGEYLPSSPYAAAKMASTAYARMFHSLYKLPVVNLRLFMVYGPGQRDLKKLVPYVILQALEGEAPSLSSGAREVDWIYIDDVVNAMLCAGIADGIDGASIDVGTGELETVAGVVKQLVAATNPDITPQFGALQERHAEVVRRANVAQSRETLGWQPEVTLAEGLARTASWYREARHSGRLVDAVMPWHGASDQKK